VLESMNTEDVPYLLIQLAGEAIMGGQEHGS
jgi:hypothetical protein